MRFRHHLHAFTWLALVAMLGLALLPSVSHALMARQAASPWAQICSVGSPATTDGQRTAEQHLAHCKACCSASATIGMPPVVLAVLPAPERVALVPPLYLQATRPLHAWTAAQARAPPRFS